MAFALFKAGLLLAHISCFALWILGATAARLAAARASPDPGLVIRFRLWTAFGAVFAGPLGLGLVFANWSALTTSQWAAVLLAAGFWFAFLIGFIRAPAGRTPDRIWLERAIRLAVFAAALAGGLAILAGIWAAPPPYVGAKMICFGAASALVLHAPDHRPWRRREFVMHMAIAFAAFLGVWRPIFIA